MFSAGSQNGGLKRSCCLLLAPKRAWFALAGAIFGAVFS
jgi:hypothetical protein